VPGILDRLRRAPPPEVAAAARSRLARLLAVSGTSSTVATADESAVPPATNSDPERPAGIVVDPARRGAIALTCVAVAATVVTGSLVWRSRPRPLPIQPPTVVASTGAVSSADVVVDVQGWVRRPGLVTLPGGARVADALAAAGGPRPGAGTVGLNLARRLTDGEQVVVLPPGATPPPSAAGGVASAAGAGARLDLNVATLAQLDALPGVGPVTAQRIMDWRTEHGRFATIDQLREVDGIGDKRFESLRDLVVV